MMSPTLVITTRERGSQLYTFAPASQTPLVLAGPASSNTLNRLTGSIESAFAWRSDGQQYLVLKDDIVTVYSAKTMKRMYQIPSQPTSLRTKIASAQFVGSSSVLIISGSSLHLYSSTGSISFSSAHHSLPVSSVASNADSTLIASSSASTLLIHSLTSNTHHTLNAKPSAPWALLSFAPSNRRTFLAAATTTGLVHFFDTSKPSAPLKTISILGNQPSSPPSITALIFSPTGPLLIAASANGQLTFIDTDKLKKVLEHDVGFEIEKGKVALGVDGRTMVFATGGGKLKVLDVKTRQGVKTIDVGGKMKECIEAISFQPQAPKTKSTATTSAGPSSILSESINRMRQQKYQQQQLDRPKSEIDAPLFSPIEPILPVATPSLSDLELPRTPNAFARSIEKEARTSTVRLQGHRTSPSGSTTTTTTSTSSNRSRSVTPATEDDEDGWRMPRLPSMELDESLDRKRRGEGIKATRFVEGVSRSEQEGGGEDVGRTPRPSSRGVLQPRRTPRHRSRVEEAQDEEERKDSTGCSLKSVMSAHTSAIKSDVQNLHTEVLRQGFAQQDEMRKLMERYLGDELKGLREENRRLKEENARLRRGY